MGMLERIQKRKVQGFKEFVANMESSSPQTRNHILTTGFLEDPLYITYVIKNMKTFEDFLNLPSDEIRLVISGHEQLVRVLSKSVSGSDEKTLNILQTAIPLLMGNLKDELLLLKDVSEQEKEASRLFMIKSVRKFQFEEKIHGFPWILPPETAYLKKKLNDGECKIFFENQSLAAKGCVLKGKRTGDWIHLYENGKLFAQGAYLEGLKTGNWIFYYGNGHKKSEGHYQGDEKKGRWKNWDRDGREFQKNYSD